jgi:hypothetical protein
MNDGITARLNRLIEGGAAACPLASRGQESVDLPKFGLLYPGPADAAAARAKIVWEGLKESGYVEGRNLVLVSRAADSNPDDFRTAATRDGFCAT